MDKYSLLTSNHLEAIGWFLVQLGATVWGSIKWVGWFLKSTYIKFEKLLAGQQVDIQELKQKVAVHDVLFEKLDGNVEEIKGTLIRMENRMEKILFEKL